MLSFPQTLELVTLQHLKLKRATGNGHENEREKNPRKT
jgi:hypothetical protein